VDTGDDLVTGSPIMSSRQLPETQVGRSSTWVWVGSLPSGGIIACYHSGPNPWWEEKDTGRRFSIKQRRSGLALSTANRAATAYD
jgi:hypothetical protein